MTTERTWAPTERPEAGGGGITLSPEVFEEVAAAASARGLTPSEFVARVLLAASALLEGAREASDLLEQTRVLLRDVVGEADEEVEELVTRARGLLDAWVRP